MTTIPITLQPVPVPVGFKAADINELLTVICQYISASVQVDVSFFQQGPNTPLSYTTPVFFNTTQRIFLSWDSNLGKYLVVTQFEPGDVMANFVAGDSPLLGWVVCDGRLLTAIQGISQTQLSALQQLFGVGGSLPNIPPALFGPAGAVSSVYIGAP